MGTIASEFKGLPMEDLIGGPLTAACTAQVRLANATADFIKVVGFLPPSPPPPGPPPADPDPDAVGDIRNVSFKFTRPTPPATTGGASGTETVDLTVPLLAVVKIPALSVDTVDIVFDMEVKTSSSTKSSQDEALSMQGSVTAKWGVARVSVSIQGSVATHKENTRSTDNSAKYHVELHASDKGMPEGLSRVLDILNSAIVPVVPPPSPPPPPPA